MKKYVISKDQEIIGSLDILADAIEFCQNSIYYEDENPHHYFVTNSHNLTIEWEKKINQRGE